MKSEEVFEQHFHYAYAKLWQRRDKAIKAKIEARTDFSANIHHKPIKLLRAIKRAFIEF